MTTALCNATLATAVLAVHQDAAAGVLEILIPKECTGTLNLCHDN